ncbi:unnamed protein product [Brachionus calyciflorus]|uniref:Apple domain-containing protein n=1 Tax=Brachionus calyciflorus TaxID=104777 RepID=A0A814IC29_9BILA|nr:unnamed protein product [Brachionus calyciflorus]
MKYYFVGLFGLSLLIFSHTSNLYSENFGLKNFTIADSDSLILEVALKNKFLCLQKCFFNPYCLYVRYENNNCSLFTQDAIKNDLNSTNVKTVYEKKKFNFQEEEAGNSNQIESNGTCLNSSEFWSLKTNSCLPCKPGFIKYSEVLFLCYHYQSGLKNYTGSKAYCISKSSFLFKPKTKIERNFFVQKFPLQTAYINSTTNELENIFKLPIGYSFDSVYSLVIGPKGLLNDVFNYKLFNLTICQHD